VMASDIGKGDWVEYVGINIPNGVLSVGSIYHVRDLTVPLPCEHCGKTMAGLVLTDYWPANGKKDWGFSPCAFRPLKRGQERITRKALQRHPEKVRT